MRLPFALIVVAACAAPSKPVQLSPLPPDPKPEDKPEVAAKPNPEPAQPKPDAPAGPLEVKIPAAKVTVKLVSAGKGTRAPLRYTAKPGDKQAVEVAMDFTAKQADDEQIVPTLVLIGSVETKAVDASGNAEYALTVSGTDARDAKGSKIPADKFKPVLAALAGLTIGGTLATNGAAGEVTMRMDKATELTQGALELIRITLPTWPMLPAEPIGLGAKWQSTATAKLADKLDVTQVTTYELVAHKGTAWTIKGTTKVTGIDQDVDDGKITKISGAGTSEATIADGSLYPKYTTTVETTFTATPKAPAAGEPAPATTAPLVFALKVGGAISPPTAAGP